MPVRVPRHCGAFVLAGAVLATAGIASAQPWPPGPGAQSPGQNYQTQVCTRLEGQLAAIDRGAGGDPARAEQVRRYEEAARRQQTELDTMTAQGRRQGCEGTGFFLFSGFQSQQCVDLNRQISRMRANLDRINVDLQRLQGGDVDRGEQRRSVMMALAQNNCGAQYRTATRTPGFFDQLLGRDANESAPPSDLANQGAQSGSVRTICVRTCDGFYFPVSYATNASRLRDDEKTCQRMCPAAEVMLFSYPTEGGEVAQRDLDQRPDLFVAAERVQVSAGVQCRLQLQARRPELGRRARQGRGGRSGRHRGDRGSRQAAVATAGAEGPEGPPAARSGARTGGAAGRRAASRGGRRDRSRQAHDPLGRPDVHSAALDMGSSW